MHEPSHHKPNNTQKVSTNMSLDLSSIASTIDTSGPGFGIDGDVGLERADPTGGYNRDEFLKIDDGQTVAVRLLGIDWIVVDQYGSVPTKPAPGNLKQGATWPKSMPAVCRRTQWIQEKIPQLSFDPIHAAYPELKATPCWYGLAVVREQVYEGTQAVGWKDAQVPALDDQGNAIPGQTKPRIVVLSFRPTNFFNPLRETVRLYGVDQNGTSNILRHEVVIKRTGNDRNNTHYTFAAIPNPSLDLSNPESMAYYMQFVRPGSVNPLLEIVLERATDEFYEQWFFASPEEAAQQPAVARPTQEATNDQVAAMQARIQQYGQQQAPQAAPAPASAPQVVQTAPTMATAPVAAPTAPVAPPATVAPQQVPQPEVATNTEQAAAQVLGGVIAPQPTAEAPPTVPAPESPRSFS